MYLQLFKLIINPSVCKCKKFFLKIYLVSLFSPSLPPSLSPLSLPPSLPPSYSYHLAIPRILNSSNNISILEGGDVFINCTIESSPDADVTWYKDGVQVTEADNSRIDIQIEDGSRQDVNLYELIIRNVIVSDSAVYECSAINTIIPSSVSAAITLNVTTDIGKSHDHTMYVIHIHVHIHIHNVC